MKHAAYLLEVKHPTLEISGRESSRKMARHMAEYLKFILRYKEKQLRNLGDAFPFLVLFNPPVIWEVGRR